MDKAYEPHSIEQRWYSTWEEAGYFAPAAQGAPYCIMIPPPNVTGSLHMGHAFQDTLMDVLTRYQRMRGSDTLWQVGTDHAGIATQMVVERQLNGEGKTRHDLGREAFLDRVWAWKGQSGGTITRQLRRMGASVDWSRERFTMDDGLSAAVREVFVRLHDEGLIYRGKRLVNWDPVLHTAVSDLEVVSQEEQGHLWHLRYPLASGEGFLVVATTRPETMLGDTAVAVNPDDERYKHLIGQMLRLPITHREIPIVGDDHADPAFGSGCVKITPAHDFNDYAVGMRHGLPLLNIFDASARILPLTDIPTQLHGLDRYEARDLVLHELQELGLVEKIDDHKLMVPRGDRTGVVIEPYLTDQWFVDLTRDTQADGRPGGRKAITEPALAAVRGGQVTFVPRNWENTYFQWLDNIQDWCISRQIWWGHRIPAWYGPDGQFYVARSEDEVRAKFGLAADVPLRQDDDVLDTWFSSALWPFSTLGWPDATPELARYYPTAVLVTGFDIIFFWVARMIMMGLKFMGDVPFREVYIHGLVRDAEGQKMSKSKGNVLDPLDLIDGITLDALLEKRTSGLMQPQMAARIDKQTRKDFPDGIAAFGTDALRMTFASLASTGRDIRFDLKRVEGYRNFCNKLWNAARYVSMNVEAGETAAASARLGIAERWIWSRFEKAVATVKASLVDYRFDLAAQALYEFTWNEYCDWYLELAKISLQGDDASLRQGTRDTLVGVLESLLRAVHPFMPYITEEIWQRVGPLAGVAGVTIMNRPYPEAGGHEDGVAEAEVAWIKEMILAVRRIRGEMNIPPGKPLPLLVQNGGDSERRRLAEHRDFLIRLGRIDAITWLEPADIAPESATALVGEMKVMIPMSGLIDKQAELTRLDKELQRLVKERERLDGKLQDPSFIAKAPPPVVAKEQARLAEVVASLTEFEKQRLRIAAL